MKNIYTQIEELLKEQPLCKEELEKKTGHSYDGLRGRISEMRKMGYEIKPMNIPTKKYVLLKIPSKMEMLDSFREWTFEEENFMRENFFRLKLGEICKKLNRPKYDVKRKAIFMGMCLR